MGFEMGDAYGFAEEKVKRLLEWEAQISVEEGVSRVLANVEGGRRLQSHFQRVKTVRANFYCESS